MVKATKQEMKMYNKVGNKNMRTIDKTQWKTQDQMKGRSEVKSKS